MSPPDRPHPLGDDPASIDSQAVAWSDALGAAPDDAALRQACRAWCDEHPDHAAAFARIDRAYQLARAVGGHRPLLDLENETLARIAATARRSRLRQRRRRRWAAAATVAAVAISLGLYSGGRWDRLQYLPEHARYLLAGEGYYRTDVGERRTVTLADGSALTLNTNTRAVVDFHARTRDIRLLAGQALFEVAPDKTRPFIVTAGTRTVTALGTAFDVRLEPNRVEVTLIEGKVEVTEVAAAAAEGAALMTPDSASPTPDGAHGTEGAALSTQHSSLSTVLSPGQRLIALASTPAVVEPANPARITSWRQGQVIFENDPLDKAIRELNRYGTRKLVLNDPRLHDMRVSGAFNISDTRNFINMLTVYLPVQVVAVDRDQIVLGYRNL